MSENMKIIQVTIDRIEEDIAVIELPEIEFIEIPVKYLPDSVKEGNVLDITISINEKEEKKRIQEIKSLQQELLDRNND